MKKRKLTIHCKGGLRLQAAARVVAEAEKHQSTVRVHCRGCPFADACSIFDLLSLGAGEGSRVEVEADGPDEEAALDALSEIFTDGGGI